MIDTIKFRWRLAKLQRSGRKTEIFFRKLIADATREKEPADEIDRLEREARFEADLVNDEIGSLVTGRLISLANNYLLPTPEFKPEGGAWEQSSGTYRLTTEAISELRAAVRKEQKERHEHMLMWVATLTGLVGAISGLIAVIGSG